MAYIPKQKRKSYQPEKEKAFGKDPFYNLKVWRQTSHAIRAIYKGICQVCKDKPSDMTDHLISREVGGADFDQQNLLPMCHICHNKKRGLEAHTNEPLVPTRQSGVDGKLVPQNKEDIIYLLTVKKYKPDEI